MNILTFTIQIKASKEKVWNTLWDDRTYRIWTGVFSEGSHIVTDWKEGGRILFLNGNRQGMYSVIEKNQPYDYMFFKHLGEIKDDKEIPFDLQMSGSIENYTLSESAGFTKLTVEVEIEEKYQDYFNEQFPVALEKVKTLSEE